MAALRGARIEDAAEIARLAGELSYPADMDAVHARPRELLLLPQHRISHLREGSPFKPSP